MQINDTHVYIFKYFDRSMCDKILWNRINFCL